MNNETTASSAPANEPSGENREKNMSFAMRVSSLRKATVTVFGMTEDEVMALAAEHKGEVDEHEPEHGPHWKVAHIRVGPVMIDFYT